MNYLYYGDNLEILRTHIDDESVDLIYIDPPFNSNQAYNAFCSESRNVSTVPRPVSQDPDTYHSRATGR